MRRQTPRLRPCDLGPVVRRNIGARLSWLLRRRNITQKELAEASGVSRSVVSRAVMQQRAVTVDALVRISLVLEVDPSWLLGMDGATGPSARTVESESAPPRGVAGDAAKEGKP